MIAASRLWMSKRIVDGEKPETSPQLSMLLAQQQSLMQSPYGPSPYGNPFAGLGLGYGGIFGH